MLANPWTYRYSPDEVAENAERRESDRALQRHKEDVFAHAPMANRVQLEWEGRRVERDREVEEQLTSLNRRLSSLERFQWMVMGGLLVVSAILGGGSVSLLIYHGPKP